MIVRRWLRPIAAAVGLALSVSGVVLMAEPPSAATVTIVGGALSGRVTDRDDGTAVAEVEVRLHQVVGGVVGDELFKVAVTDAAGRWSLDRIYPGTYTIEFRGLGDHGGTWWGDEPTRESADTFRIEAGQVVQGLSTTLGPPAVVRGRVTTAAGEAVVDRLVEAESVTASGPFDQTVRTDAEGRYSFRMTVADRYTLRFDGLPDFPGRWWGATGAQSDLYDPQILPGRVYVVDQVLGAAGRAEGTVTDAAGDPVRSVQVEVYGLGFYNRPTTTDDRGRWSVGGLLAGSYTVGYSGTRDTVPAGAPATVRASQTTSLSQQLRPAAHLAGVISDPTGAPLTYQQVEVQRVDVPQGSVLVSTGDDGRYALDGLVPGAYTVSVNTGSGSPFYPWRSWPTAGSRFDAVPISLTEGETRDDVDVTMVPNATVSGRVRGPDGPVAGARLSVLATRADGEVTDTVGSGVADRDGRYTLHGLPNGRFRVVAEDPAHQLAARYAGDAAWASGAAPVTVRAGQDTGGVDIVMRRGARLTGRVLDSAGRPVTRALYVSLATPRDLVRETAVPDVGADGRYSVTGLRPGRYRVEVYCDAIFGDSSSASTDVVVDATGSTVADLDVPDEAHDSCSPYVVGAGSPTLVGEPRVGRTVRVRPWRVRTAHTLVTYSWWAGSRKLSNQGTALRLKKGMRGSRIRVRAVVTRPGFHSLHLASKPTPKVR